MPFLVLLSLLALPVFAIQRLGGQLFLAWCLRFTGEPGHLLGLRQRQTRCRAGALRIPEFNLHLLELLGGWPGAFLAQRRLRHKCAKARYQIVFWLIVLLHQFAALEASQNWNCLRAAGKFLAPRTQNH